MEEKILSWLACMQEIYVYDLGEKAFAAIRIMSYKPGWIYSPNRLRNNFLEQKS